MGEGYDDPTAERALAAIFVRHRPSLRRTLQRLGVAEANLDGAVQDVFVVLVRRIDDYDPDRAEGSIASWLQGIARRIASNHRRGDARARRLRAELATAPPVELGDAQRTHAAQILHEFLERLSPEHLRGLHNGDGRSAVVPWTPFTERVRGDPGAHTSDVAALAFGVPRLRPWRAARSQPSRRKEATMEPDSFMGQGGAPTPELERPRASAWLATLALTISCYTTGDPIDGSTGVDTGGYETTGGGEPLLTFWISETTNFGQSAAMGCANTNVNQVGANFRDILQDDGWAGTYDLNAGTTRLDFADPGQLLGGLDDAASDSAVVAVYAGHGSINALQWGNPDGSNACVLTPSTQMRLGSGFGDTARLAVFVTSCTMNVPNLQTTIGASSAGQYVGWHNSPLVNDFVLRDFYDTTNYMIENGKQLTNRLSWMAVGQVKPGLGGNSPVIFTEQGEDDKVQARHFGARISEGTGMETIPEMPGDNFRVTWVDNGGC